jgi:hypothetical protein
VRVATISDNIGGLVGLPVRHVHRLDRHGRIPVGYVRQMYRPDTEHACLSDMVV